MPGITLPDEKQHIDSAGTMGALTDDVLMTPDEFLAFERKAAVKHEYVGGIVTAMAGASRSHNVIVSNLIADINRHLRGGPCQAFVSDMKVRVETSEHTVFYYPDIVVTCDGRDRQADEHFISFPKLIIEVLSPSTERLDRLEKFDHYRRISTLEEYTLVAPNPPEARVHRAANGWQGVHQIGTLELQSIGLTLGFAEIFSGV